MKHLMISAAVLALAGAAHAQDAYVTQVGAQNTAVNYSEEYRGGGPTQVIAQQGEGFSAANFARGNNTAMAYQLDTGYPTSNMADSDPSTPGLDGGTMNSLIWQRAEDGPSSATNMRDARGGNTAIAVQLSSPGTDYSTRDYNSQILQRGSDNVAVNWQHNRGGAMRTFGINNGPLATITTPQLTTFNPNAASLPTPVLPATTVPYNGSVGIN
ncbi:MAG: hypothetical protein V2J12_13280 [Gammaproteobacteria bacterium]|jgi:hypothetical protein|nr:hypothetical protein [Gammaproteobacteria bacterium]